MEDDDTSRCTLDVYRILNVLWLLFSACFGGYVGYENAKGHEAGYTIFGLIWGFFVGLGAGGAVLVPLFQLLIRIESRCLRKRHRYFGATSRMSAEEIGKMVLSGIGLLFVLYSGYFAYEQADVHPWGNGILGMLVGCVIAAFAAGILYCLFWMVMCTAFAEGVGQIVRRASTTTTGPGVDGLALGASVAYSVGVQIDEVTQV